MKMDPAGRGEGTLEGKDLPKACTYYDRVPALQMQVVPAQAK